MIDFVKKNKKKKLATFAERLVWKGQVYGGNERERTNVAFVEIDSELREASERTLQRKGPVNSYFIWMHFGGGDKIICCAVRLSCWRGGGKTERHNRE